MPKNVEEDFPVLSSAAQLTAIEPNRELVVVPEWRTKVWVQEFTGKEMDAYRSAMTSFNKRTQDIEFSLSGSSLRLVVLAMRDANGNPLYPNLEKGMAIVGTLPTSGLERVADAARRVNNMAGAGDAELTGKSDSAHGTDSSEDSA